MLLEFITSGSGIVKITFVNGSSVSGSFAEDFVELVLEESAHEVADHVVVIAHVENGSNVKVEGWIATNWRTHSDHSSSTRCIKQSLMITFKVDMN